MLLNQQHQSHVDGITPMPTDRVDDTSTVNTSTSETVVWQYNNSGSWGAAATQAAGTMCYSKLTYSGILNNQGSGIGCKNDTSLSVGATTRIDTLVYVPEEAFSKMESMSVADKVAYIATWLTTNGYYAIDHRRGAVWGKHKATVANDAMTYKYATTLTGGGAGDKVDVIKVGGVATPVEDSAVTSTGIHPLWESKDCDGSALPNSTNEGDATRPACTLAGVPYAFLTNEGGTASPIAVEDAAIAATLGDAVVMAGFEAKDLDGSALPNATAEGDASRAAVTLNGVQITTLTSEDGAASAVAVEDAAIGAASGDAVVMSGFEAKDIDGSALPNATVEGDASRAAVTLNGVQIATLANEDGSNCAVAAEDAAIAAGIGDAVVMAGYETKDFDGSALPNATAEGDASRGAVTLNGVQFTMPVNEDGSLTAIYGEDAAHTSGDGGFHVLTVRDDAPVAKAGTDGDYQSFTTDDTGALWVRNRGYDTGSDSVKSTETSPIWNKHVEETLATVTNETSGTNYYYTDWDSFKHGGWQIATSDTTPTDTLTITVEATLQDDGTAAASCDYDDITLAEWGVASWVDQDVLITLDEPRPYKYVRIKTVTAGGSNDHDYTIYHKRLY